MMSRRSRRLGGRASSQNERAPAMQKMRESPGEVRTFNWRAQCFCGGTKMKWYRKTWWCIGCGLEFVPRPGVDQPSL